MLQAYLSVLLEIGEKNHKTAIFSIYNSEPKFKTHTGESIIQSCLCPIMQCKINDLYLEMGIKMNQDPLASCGDPGSENRKVCTYDFFSFFYL